MRKQTKVLAAAALFTLGASFSVFAAKTGRWVLEDEGWMCYDKDGDPYTNEWCLSAGKEFYMGDDGVMVTSDWVEYDNNHYYVGSNGAKTLNDWRYVTPIDDDEADEEWFYFDNKGKRVDNKKKVIGGKTYYFENDGIMLTGWVDTNSKDEASARTLANDLTYCDEDGARVTKNWVKVYAPGVDLEEDDLDDYSQYWYYLDTYGTPAVGKKANIKGQTYLFNNNGQMQTGWVALSVSEGGYIRIGTKGQNRMINDADFSEVYFCGGSDDGHVKKDKWIKEWRNTEYNAADDDNEQYWFYIKANGQVYIPTTSDATADIKNVNLMELKEGAYAQKTDDSGRYLSDNVEVKTIGKKVYAINMQGEMVSGFVQSSSNANMFYFGGEDDGARKSGSFTVRDDNGEVCKFHFATDVMKDSSSNVICGKAVGVTGAKNGKLYKDGLLVTSSDYKYHNATVSINGVNANFIVNGSGTIQIAYKNYDSDSIDVPVDLRNNNNTVSFNRGTTNRLFEGSYTVR